LLQVREYVGSSVLKGTAVSPAVTLSPAWQMVTVDYVVNTVGSYLDVQVLDTPVATGEVFQVDNISIRASIGNRAPILNAIANMTVAEGATTDQAVTGSDPDGDALTFTKAGGPSFLTVTTTSPTTGNIHLAPGFSDAGTYAASAAASDGSLSDTKPFQITVTNVNQAPTLNAIANMTVAEGATADQAVTGSDPDGDALTFTKGSGPTFLTVSTTNATTGSIHVAPGFGDAGTYAASASASDGSLSDTKPFQITVRLANRAPT